MAYSSIRFINTFLHGHMNEGIFMLPLEDYSMAKIGEVSFLIGA